MTGLNYTTHHWTFEVPVDASDGTDPVAENIGEKVAELERKGAHPVAISHSLVLDAATPTRSSEFLFVDVVLVTIGNVEP